MKKSIIAIMMGMLGLGLIADTAAFTYQACIRDELGAVIKENGETKHNFTIELRLYNAKSGGTALWARTYSVLADDTGLFSLAVTDDSGSEISGATYTTLADVFKNTTPGSLFVGIKVVGSAGEIVPRQAVYAAPFAAMANDVRAVSGDLSVGGNITLKNSDNTKSVVVTSSGITQNGGTTTLQKLAVNGDVTISQGGLSVGGVLTANGDGVVVKGHPLNVKDTQLQVNGAEIVPVPVGGIIIWTKEDLPDSTHWAICDGQKGTPDLTARFVVGAGSSSSRGNYAFKETGGEASVTLTVDQIPSHAHTYSFTGADLAAAWKNNNNFYCQANHYSGNTNAKWTNAAGGGQAHENRPPYYALYYIMRIK